jgi:hypothetical protein
MRVINLNFFHDGKQWIVRDKDLEVAASELGELDRKLRDALEQRYSPPRGTRLAVNLEFDYSTIPHWMIQYHPYYMHRRLEFDY